MNWKLILGLGATGAIPPLATVALGGNPIVALVLWTVLAAALWVPVVLRFEAARAFVTLLLVGLAAGVVAGLVDMAMLGDPMLLIFAIIVGAVWGALFGGIAVAVDRYRRSRKPASA